jgi:glutamate--cysteine ligase
MVPHLVTALHGPIHELEQRMLDTMSAIERWFRMEWMEHTPPFYGSVDVRNAGFKLAPVDTDFFPCGWNNLTPAMLPLAVQAALSAVEKTCPEARNLLIVPDNHVRNSFYLSNLVQLRRIFEMAGLNVRFGSISPDVKKPLTLAVPGGESVVLEPVLRERGRIGVKDFDPCTILLNTDLASGIPGILEDLQSQYLLPPLHASWAVRRKSRHFDCYDDAAKRFAKLIGVDPWLINPDFELCGELDLATPHGLAALRAKVEAMLLKTRRKYKEYGIKERPFVIVKRDDQHSGMGLMTLRDGKDLAAQAALLPAQGPQALVVQEGVLTLERINDAVAEPVVYMLDRFVVGGFYRVHAQQGSDELLSAPGSSYVPLAFAQSLSLPEPGMRPGASAPNRFYMYGVIARLGLLAGSIELEQTDPMAENDD